MLDIRKPIQTISLIFASLVFISLAEAKSVENFELSKSKLKLELEFSDQATKSYTSRLVSLVDTFVVEGEKLFGGPPKKVNGEPYTSLKIRLSNGLGGEASPEFIDFRISNLKAFGFIDWEIGLLHEVLHLWSGETFRYVDDQEQWFNEGVTEYLTFRIAAKLGIIKKQEIVSTFARPISTYLSAKGIGQHSLRSASKTDELKKAHYFLVYHGGFVAGMVLDHQIRSRSNREFTLENLMSYMYQTYSRDNQYSSNSILKLIQESMKLDFDTFFEKYIYGNSIIPIGDYFDIGQLMFAEFGAPIDGTNQQILAEMLQVE